jgi:sRNA-binding protein
MPTLTAPALARAAAQERGLVLPAEPVTSVQICPDVPDEKRVRATQRREQQRIARDHLWPLLSEIFPEAFRLPAVPLAIGIHHQILDIAGDSIDPAELSTFLRYWVSRWSYLMAVWRGDTRRNLDGSLSDLPTIQQRNDAAIRLWGKLAQQIAEPSERARTWLKEQSMVESPSLLTGR